jgi:hypothetical protein
MTVCANAWNADEWNTFVCSRQTGHDGPHNEVILSDMPGYDQERATVGTWSDYPELGVWYTNAEKDTFCFDPMLSGRKYDMSGLTKSY